MNSIAVCGTMESAVVAEPPKRRGRKRKNRGPENTVECDGEKRLMATRSLRLVGRYVRKDFQESGLFLGKIMSYDSGLYRVNYEDGDFEDLDSGEVKLFLVEDCDLNGEWCKKKEKLDELLSLKDVKDKVLKVEKALEPENSNQVVLSLSNDQKNGETAASTLADDHDNGNSDADADSLNGSCEDSPDQDNCPDMEEPLIPLPELPPSSGHIGVPEEYVSHLLSVNSFLRSFSVPLFLYPFGLDDFVGALNCPVANTLLDSIHVALLHVLKRHIERLSSEGSELAVKCVRCLDWNLLDNLTWPVYLVHYLIVMCHRNGPDWKEFYVHALERDYYTLSAGRKLIILQILCDDILDSEELRAEMDMREESEVGIDMDTSTVVKPTGASRRVHPRNSASSGSKDREAIKSLPEHYEIKPSLDSHSTQVGGPIESSADEDANGDECRICGMDGLLLCCDGCPLSYHSRCLGMNKMHMPEGSWYCPECKIKATEPKILQGTTLRGGHNFGVDPYGQVFVATCDHLLVLKASIDSEICIRYYNRCDIARALCALCSKAEHVATYTEICRGAVQYWQLPEETVPHNKMTEVGVQLASEVGGGVLSTHLDILVDRSVANMTEVENTGSSVITTSAADMAVSSHLNCKPEPVLCVKSLDNVANSVQLGSTDDAKEQSGVIMSTHLDNLLDGSVANSTEVENTGSCVITSCATEMAVSSLMYPKPEPIPCVNSLDKVAKPCQLGNTDYAREQSGFIVSTTMADEPGQPVDTNESSQQSTSNVPETVAYSTRNNTNNYSGPSSDAPREATMSFSCLDLDNRVDKQSNGNSYDGCLYKGSSFKTTGYINNYLHGDFAASAAANLAILSSEENHVPERSSYNRRKFMSENVSLQVKAFSSAPMQFFWPNSEKKLVEIPRERCSWCFFCKAPVVSKRGCLLNAAASNANRGAMKVLAGVRSIKNGDGRLPGVATYIIYMEESLGGLLNGPFLNDAFRKRWHKEVEQATSCNAIKMLLLELEENVRTVALSGDWIKLVDTGPTQLSTCQIAANAAGSTQKRRPGRRGRKPSAVVEVASDDCQDTSNDFTWWRGGTLSKLMFQRGVLPSSMIRKAARQGGSKEISGVYYAEGHETPKTSRQLLWRSAVEMSRNMAQFALQVRYLDFHVRWNDLVRPEQNPPDGKGPDAEASAFRNAFICDKKSVGSEVRYCIDFGNQKHLPSRVIKSVAEIEQMLLDDGKERYWFAETRIPLYLVKEYEEKLEKNKTVDLHKLQRRRWKSSCKKIFFYLARKQDIITKSNCSSCHHDVLYRDAVKCSSCQGFCHEICTTCSTVHKNEEVEFLVTCKSCSDAQALSQVQISYGSPTSPLLLQGRDLPNAGTASKSGKLVGYKRPSESVGMMDYSSEMKSASLSSTTKKSKNKNWGLIWRKNNSEDTGVNFRLKNIILRGNPDMDLTNPVCRLCTQPYNTDLMYIRCEKCEHWLHADAVELDESRVFLLAGFKCSRCRRIKNPVCPYSIKALEDKIESKAPKLDMYEMDSNSLHSGHLMEEGPVFSAIPMKEFGHVVADNRPIHSPSEVEECTDMPNIDYGRNNSNGRCSGPHKLPVRRHIKEGNDMYSPHLPDPFQINISAPFEANVLNSTGKLPVRRHMKQEKDTHSPCLPDPFQVNSSAPFEANVLNSTGKLPVRRHIKRESNSDNYSAVNSLKVETPSPSEVKAMSSVLDSHWDVSNGSFDDGITLDYDVLGFDDMEFEPQTYFSFHELLDSDNGDRVIVNGTPEDANCSQIQNLDSASTLPESGTLEISYDEEPIIYIGTDFDIAPCNMCSHTKPCPDLSCQVCGMWIHSHCSPWVESSYLDNIWRCGNCRGWG